MNTIPSLHFNPKSHDLQIRPNATAQGIPVEAAEDGSVVAVAYPWGEEIRNNSRYLIIRSPRCNWLSDSNAILHPLD